MKLLLFAVLITMLSNESDYKVTYIEKWKEVSIVESQRTGIPVSIILGQAVLESNYGNSKLAKIAKNHFGIKCKAEWAGDHFYKKDDDTDEEGNIIKSCFRSYNVDMDSFIDHSHFLLGKWCYSSLLEHNRSDYQSWAKGLYECGYATDKKYSQKLISIIETHELWKLDLVDSN